jgi:peroxiredoxin
VKELEKKYAKEGLVIIGVSDEGSSIVEKYVKDNSVTWLIGDDPGGKLMREYGAKGYPSAYLIDGSGKLAWIGHPATLQNDVIERVLKTAKKADAKAGGETSGGEKEPPSDEKKDE